MYRKQFFDALLTDYLEKSRTVLIATHQAEEVQHVLTDVLFIDRGRSSVVLPASGVSASILWQDMSLVDISRINFSHLVVYHGLWCAPVFCWFLIVSAWAPRLPFLWAVLPPVAIGVIERLAFDSTHFVGFLQSYFFGTNPSSSPRRTR